jgi:hypothetical protein
MDSAVAWGQDGQGRNHGAYGFYQISAQRMILLTFEVLLNLGSFRKGLSRSLDAGQHFGL